MLELNDISVTYPNGVQAFKGVNLSFEKGKIYGIIGPSGGGKSSLLKAILNLAPYKGKVSYKGGSIKRYAKDIAYIEQKEAIDRDFPITAFQCVLLGTYPRLGLFKRAGEAEKEAARKALADVSMLDYQNRQIGELSGGQFQRILIARALVQNADLFLLDEPFVGIDVKNEEALIQQLKSMASKGKTIVIVHHDLSKAKAYFDEIILINKKIIAVGPTAEVFTTANVEETYAVYIPDAVKA